MKYLLNVIDAFSKFAWNVPIKITGRSITDTFKLILKTSRKNPDKLFVDQGTEFYKRVFRSWLKEDNIETYSVFDEGKAVIVEKFNRMDVEIF